MARAAVIHSEERIAPGKHPKVEPEWKRLFQHASRSLRRSHTVRAAYVKMFRAMQRMGVSVTPVHFYFPVPDLNRISEKRWPNGPGESAIDYNVESQLKNLQRWSQFQPEWNFPETPDGSYAFGLNNGYFESVDAEIAYSIVREKKPRRIIEVGSGNSTRLLATAVRKNAEEGNPCELTSIEPYPDNWLQKGFPGLSQLIETRVQDLPPSFFDQLEAGDILFLDSSHVVSLGSDVVYEVLEVLPRLKPGVTIHFHDIFMPADYPKKFVMDNLCFWQEQYLLQAFLCFNQHFRVVWASSMMQLAYQNLLRKVFPKWQGSYLRMPESSKIFAPSYDGQNVWPCSLWIEKCG